MRLDALSSCLVQSTKILQMAGTEVRDGDKLELEWNGLKEKSGKKKTTLKCEL